MEAHTKIRSVKFVDFLYTHTGIPLAFAECDERGSETFSVLFVFKRTCSNAHP